MRGVWRVTSGPHTCLWRMVALPLQPPPRRPGSSMRSRPGLSKKAAGSQEAPDPQRQTRLHPSSELQETARPWAPAPRSVSSTPHSGVHTLPHVLE